MKLKNFYLCKCGVRCSVVWEIRRPNFAAGYGKCPGCNTTATYACGDRRLCNALMDFIELHGLDFEGFSDHLNSIDIKAH